MKQPKKIVSSGCTLVSFRPPDNVTVNVYARLVGTTLAVHKSTEPNVDYYVVTHLPTGLTVGTLTKKETDSVMIAEHLFYNFDSFTTGKNSEEVVGPLPKWVRRWLMKCRTECRCVDPETFRVDSDTVENDRKAPPVIKSKAAKRVEL